MRAWLLAIVVAALAVDNGGAQTAKGVRLETRTWVEAQALLQPDSVVVIPLGAALKEHGPHLKLRNDLTLAEYFTERILSAANVVVTPPLTYHFYPAFTEYPGSTSLALDTAKDMTEQVVRSLARYGPRRFYVLNTGVSTNRPLQAATVALASEGILLRHTDFGATVDQVSANIRQQEGGSHADEMETSMMLHIAPSAVDMSLAVRDLGPASTPPRLTRKQGGPGTYSPSGIWGDPTLATAAKGKIVVEGVVDRMLRDIEALRAATPPAPQPAPTVSPQPAPAVPPQNRPATASQVEGCTSGEERTVRRIADAYNLAWATLDPQAVAALWAEHGDIVHPDGATERGRMAIQQNRTEQFMRKEFSGSKHILSIGVVRCLTADVAVADGKWELKGARDRTGNPLPRAEGLLTLVAKKTGGGFLIDAYRYTVTQNTATPPTLLKKPGYPEIIK
jgi:creatinine amidohydrolase